MRRLVSALLAIALLANTAAWSVTALAELRDHPKSPPGLVEPAQVPDGAQTAHRHDQCSGHLGEHFQGQPNAAAHDARHQDAMSPPSAGCTAFTHINPAPPFPPPLGAPTQS